MNKENLMKLKCQFWSLPFGFIFVICAQLIDLTHAFAQTEPEINIGSPQVGKSDDDVHVTFNGPAIGRLIYTAYDETNPTYPTSLTLHMSGVSGPQENSKPGFYLYPVKKTGERTLSDPLFSPDGRHVLLKFGSRSGGGLTWTFLYVLDLQTSELKKISPRRINYDVASWSPDGNYIAFIEGGDSTGSAYFQAGSQAIYMPLGLYFINWRTGQEYSVFNSDTLRGPLKWTGQHKLLFGALMSEEVRPLKKRLGEDAATDRTKPVKKEEEPQPNVYEFAPENGKPALLFRDGYRPVASPNGQWVAFFGGEDSAKPLPLQMGWEDVPNGTSLSVARRDGSERRALNREKFFYPAVYWLPDNRHLVTAQQIQPSPNLRVQIKKCDTLTGKWSEVAVLQTKDFMRMQFHPAIQPFNLIGLSGDGKLLFIKMVEYPGYKPGNRRILVSTSIQAVNLESGVVIEIARITGSSGVDWSPA